jgi:predicted nucleic acid-binding protein
MQLPYSIFWRKKIRMVKVVCNASPIIGLSILGLLNLLWKLFDVAIPEEVYKEIVTCNKEDVWGKKELEKAVSEEKITVISIKDKDFVNKAYGILHKGELEVVIGALENDIKTVILDEKAARSFAKTLNLNPIGIIGILQLAKKKRIVKEIKPYLDKLIQNKYRISEKLYQKVLQDSGEI